MSTHQSWPPERFYWSVIDGVGLRRPGPLPPGLLSLAADDIPVDVETLHAVGATTDDGRIIVCAVERGHLATLRQDAVSLTPTTTPPGIDIDAAQLELLVGAFEPRSVRRRRFRTHATLAATVLACMLLLTTGLSRRAAHDRETAAKISESRETLLSDAGINPQEIIRLIERSRALAEVRSSAPRDITPALAALLRNWPDTADASVESMSLGDGRVLASVSLDADPAIFLAAFSPPPGWRLEEPRLNSVRGLTRLSLELRQEDPQ